LKNEKNVGVNDVDRSGFGRGGGNTGGRRKRYKKKGINIKRSSQNFRLKMLRHTKEEKGKKKTPMEQGGSAEIQKRNTRRE